MSWTSRSATLTHAAGTTRYSADTTDARHPRLVAAIGGGFAGTAVMTLMMYFVAPMMLGAPMDVAAMLGGMLGGSWMAGMLMHFVNGAVVFPLVYRHGFFRWLPGEPWTRGMLFGGILWVLSQAVVAPMMGGGFFSARAGGGMAVMASLLAHAVYGVLLGAIGGGVRGSSTPGAQASR